VDTLPDLRPAVLFRPSLLGLKVLRAADVVLANDISDPERCWVCKGFDVPAGGTMPDGEPVMIVVVELDMDTTELPWLIAAANDLSAAWTTPSRWPRSCATSPPSRR